MFKYLLLLILGVHTIGSFSLCDKDEKCISSDECYECVSFDNNMTACIPIYKEGNKLYNGDGINVLEKYKNWNCSIYNKEESNIENISIIKKIESEKSVEELIDEICKIDHFVDEICNITVGNNDNGFCMIASYINDICHLKSDFNVKEETKQHKLFNKGLALNKDIHIYTHENYISPWGSESECLESFYKNMCSNKLVKYCYDCRFFLGKELFTQKSKYSYYCTPYYNKDDEQELLNWIKKEKYECRKWINKHFKPSFKDDNSTDKIIRTSPLIEGIYPACSGPICSKQGWQFQKTDYGRDWCGLGECKPINKRYYCSYPTNCGKKINTYQKESELEDQKEYQVLGCGKEKFKCVLKKSCRQLIKRLDECEKDISCITNLIIENSNNNEFNDLVKCIL